MESERQRQTRLQRQLSSQRPRGDARCHNSALEVDAQCGGDQITDTVEVEDAGEDDAGDAVECRGDPGHLPFVDGEVGSDGALKALLCEDLGAGILRDGLGGCLSACPYCVSFTFFSRFQMLYGLIFTDLLCTHCTFIATAAGEAYLVTTLVGRWATTTSRQ